MLALFGRGFRDRRNHRALLQLQLFYRYMPGMSSAGWNSAEGSLHGLKTLDLFCSRAKEVNFRKGVLVRAGVNSIKGTVTSISEGSTAACETEGVVDNSEDMFN